MAVQPLSGVGGIGPGFAYPAGAGGDSWASLERDLLSLETAGSQEAGSVGNAEKTATEMPVGKKSDPSATPGSDAIPSRTAEFLRSPLVANLLGPHVLPPDLIEQVSRRDVSLGELMVLGHEVSLHATYVGLVSKISDSGQKAVTQLAQASG
jgi:hypothetical protein